MNIELTEALFRCLLTYFVHSSVFLLLALLVTSTGWIRQLAVRELVWKCALLAGLVTAPLQASGILDPVPRPLAMPEPVRTASVEAAAEFQPGPTAPGLTMTAVQAPQAHTPQLSPVAAALLAWTLVGALMLVRLAALAAGLVRQLQHRHRVGDGWLRCQARELADTFAIRAPRLSTQPGLSSPFCVVTGEIVLPEWVLALPRGQQRAMLAHEMAHLKRRDPAWLLLGKLVQAVAFFQPLNWVAARKLSELSEFACDAWSKKLCHSGLALAECLAECARRQSRPPSPTLVMAMASGRSPIIERTHQLLHGKSDEARAAPVWARWAVACAIIMIALLIPGFAVGEREGHGAARSLAMAASSSGSIAIESGGVMTVNMDYSDNSRELSINGHGRFGFNAEETAMVSISNGGYLDITEEAGGHTRRVRFEEAGGEVNAEFWLDGAAEPESPAMHAWLGQVIPTFYRATGLDAEARAERIYRRSGSSGVLAEMNLVPGSYSLRSYAVALAGLTELDDAESAQLFDRVSDGVMGSYDLRETLAAYAQSQRPSDSEWLGFARAAEAIPSSYDLRATLSGAAGRYSGPPDNWNALLVAASRISSSHDLRETLVAFSRHLPADDRTMLRLAETAGEIDSSHDLRQTISAYARRGAYGTGGWLALLDAASGIPSGFDRRETLVEIAKKMPRETPLVSRYREVAAGISGQYDREQAERAL